MTCTSCGDAPRKGSKCFPDAGLTITNPAEYIVFRKTVVPASLGDDTAVPAAVGKYANTLVYYEANGHTYLYSSDRIPTRIDGGKVYDDLATRVKQLETEIEALKNKENA